MNGFQKSSIQEVVKLMKIRKLQQTFYVPFCLLASTGSGSKFTWYELVFNLSKMVEHIMLSDYMKFIILSKKINL